MHKPKTMQRSKEDSLLDKMTLYACGLILLTGVGVKACMPKTETMAARFESKISELPESGGIDEVEEIKPVDKISHVVSATRYNPVKSQCWGDPLVTADGGRINLKKLKSGELRWIAISRDLQEHFNFGDTVYVSGGPSEINGPWVVKDLMGPRWKKKIDFLSPVHKNTGRWAGLTISKI